ncbi:pseudouridine synthase [Dimargaris cristalligena]|uniref:Pseudouridine synthase n=1 Tax=Dimargaris cristalligena TaxID=215637 RepID=A0A4P9ZYM0_9FUNG|nr:pseudouridine synthase [Dimargaris cristalligena]|eukprot:RKP37850.1 pseudouridine synthase [Dimargaris cristalligena]
MPGKSKDQRNKPRPNTKLNQLPGEGEVVAFHLCKENQETMHSIQTIAKLGGLQPKNITSAGTKDRRGVTTQVITVQRANPERLAGLNKRLVGMRVGDFHRMTRLLKLGDLYGNRFTVTLRDLQLDVAQATPEVSQWIQNGFINYFGLQRFGNSPGSATHDIGRAILQGNAENAVNLILQPRPEEVGEMAEVRQAWQTNRDANAIFKRVPRRCVAERDVLFHLAKRGAKDFAGALQAIPFHLRSLYLHGYQSYVWNHMASERIRLYGASQLVPGDLVVVSKEQPSEEVPSTIDASDKPNDASEGKRSPHEQVEVVTEDTVNQYSIADLVLPLPGFDMKYPTNAVGQAYVDFMKRDQLDPLQMKRAVKNTSLPGSYRRVLGQVEDATFKFIRYEDPSQPLCITDMDRAQNREVPAILDQGQHLALQVEFTLRSSCYATMCLRELTRTSSSPAFNTSLTKQHAQPPKPSTE